MGYVESLLREKLDAHRQAYMEAFDNHTVNECIALGNIIRELELVIEILNNSSKYQNL